MSINRVYCNKMARKMHSHKKKKLTKYLKRHNRGKSFNNKISHVMHEYGEGKLHSHSKSGPIVTDRRQALAIGILYYMYL